MNDVQEKKVVNKSKDTLKRKDNQMIPAKTVSVEEMLRKKREYTKAYMKKQDMLYLRLPAENKELGIPDYKQMITKYAKERGVSVNGLLTALIEKELNIEINGLNQIRDNARRKIREQ